MSEPRTPATCVSIVPAGMETATSTKAAPVAMPRIRESALRLGLALATVVGVAGVLRLVYEPHLNYDARYSLLWARDIWHGFKPDYGADFAPTPHPLQTALSSLGLPFGNAADQVLVWLVLLSFGALVWLAYRLGAELFSPWVGGVTALVVLTRPALEHDALLAYQDVPFATLVAGAVLLEARRSRRGAPVLALLAVAGLLRPEAWFLSALYLAYMWPAISPRQRVKLTAIAGAAPLLWALSDLLVTGDLLHSLHSTADLAEEQNRRRNVVTVPYWTAKYFGYTLREPLGLGVPIGLTFAWLYRRRAATLPVAAAAAMTLIFGIGPIFGLPLIGRYIRTPAVLLAIFYGLAVFGWLLLPPGPARRRWLAAGMFALALSVIFLPKQVDLLDGFRHRLQREQKLYADLRHVGESSTVRTAFAACKPISTADQRPIPYLRWWLDGHPGSVGTVARGASPLGRLLLVPRDTALVRRFYGKNFPRIAPPADYRRLYQNRSWRVYAAPGCSQRPAPQRSTTNGGPDRPHAASSVA